MRYEKQLWKCNECGKQFRKKSKNNIKTIWNNYTHGKQTYKQIGAKFHKSTRWAQYQMDKAQIQKEFIEAGDTVICMDTTYFGRTFGVMVFRCPKRKKNLLWKFVSYETIKDYIEGIEELKKQGWNIQGMVADARKGLLKAFPNTPIQLCQFHQVQIVQRYITKNPKLQAGKELKEVLSFLTQTDEQSFSYLLQQWHEKWKEFLSEKTVDLIKKRSRFTHRRLRSAYRSLKTNFPWLFTCQRYPKLEMPNTNNSLEGTFSQMKKKINVHPGLKIHRKQKLIEELLLQN